MSEVRSIPSPISDCMVHENLRKLLPRVSMNKGAKEKQGVGKNDRALTALSFFGHDMKTIARNDGNAARALR